MGIAVRRAVESDVGWLLNELKQFEQFVDAPCPLIEDEHYARQTLLTMVTQHVFFVAESQCEITACMVPVGFLAALETPHPFNPRLKLLSEQFWWVSPQARGTSAGARLLKEYVEYGKQHADLMTIALEDQSPIKTQSLEKRGFRLSERSFVYDTRSARAQGVA